MTQVFFVEQVQHNKTTGQWTKGVVVKADDEADNEAAALQSYHAYLGAYAYGNNPDIDYVYCRLYGVGNIREPLEEEWNTMA